MNARRKLNLLYEYVHALIRSFYLRPSVAREAIELSESAIFTCDILGRKGRCTMSELSKECGLALSSMTGVINKLVARGCVTRKRDEEDRRKVYVELDKKGQRIYQEMLETEMEIIIRIMDALKPNEQDALLRTLGKAVGSLEK